MGSLENNIKNINDYLFDIIPFEWTSPITAISTTNLINAITISFPYDFYLTSIAIATINTTANTNIYITIGDSVSFNDQSSPASISPGASINFSWTVPFIPKVLANNNLSLYAYSSAAGSIQLFLLGFRLR